VLAVGSRPTEDSVMATAEMFDLESGTWTPAGGLDHARGGQSATLLANGMILVAGGSDRNGPLDSVELYDPATGRWESISQARGEWADVVETAQPRAGHTATRLTDGRVVIAGGRGSSEADDFLDSAEIYDPSANRWSNTGSLNQARDSHIAVLMDNGTVLVAGGRSASSPDRSEATASAEVYDPSSGTWTTAGAMTTARWDHTATVLWDGRLLVTGGTANGEAISSAEVFDPASGTWSVTGEMGTGRAAHSAILLGSGKVIVAGGGTRSVELYDPSSGEWSTVAELNSGALETEATLLGDGRPFILSVSSTPDSPPAAELYDAESDSWDLVANLAYDRKRTTVTLLENDSVLIVGGSAATLSVLYEPVESKWFSAGKLRVARVEHAATVLENGTVLVVGGVGRDGKVLSSVELYKPEQP